MITVCDNDFDIITSWLKEIKWLTLSLSEAVDIFSVQTVVFVWFWWSKYTLLRVPAGCWNSTVLLLCLEKKGRYIFYHLKHIWGRFKKFPELSLLFKIIIVTDKLEFHKLETVLMPQYDNYFCCSSLWNSRWVFLVHDTVVVNICHQRVYKYLCFSSKHFFYHWRH